MRKPTISRKVLLDIQMGCYEKICSTLSSSIVASRAAEIACAAEAAWFRASFVASVATFPLS